MSKGQRRWQSMIDLIEAHERDWRNAVETDELEPEQIEFAVRALLNVKWDVRRMAQGQAALIWKSA